MSELSMISPPSQTFLDEYSGNILITAASLIHCARHRFVIIRCCDDWYGLGWPCDTCGLACEHRRVCYWNRSAKADPRLLRINRLLIIAVVLVKNAGVGYHLARVVADDLKALMAWANSLCALEMSAFFAVALPKMLTLLLSLKVFSNRMTWIGGCLGVVLFIGTCVLYIIASSL